MNIFGGIVLLLVLFAGIEITRCSRVDYSTAKYEVRQMVRLKANGGQGQILRRTGTNEGPGSWDLTPVFEYEVRHGRLSYTVEEWFLEWELEPIKEKP
jgi:hypothetical protein